LRVRTAPAGVAKASGVANEPGPVPEVPGGSQTALAAGLEQTASSKNPSASFVPRSVPIL